MNDVLGLEIYRNGFPLDNDLWPDGRKHREDKLLPLIKVHSASPDHESRRKYKDMVLEPRVKWEHKLRCLKNIVKSERDRKKHLIDNLTETLVDGYDIEEAIVK